MCISFLDNHLLTLNPASPDGPDGPTKPIILYWGDPLIIGRKQGRFTEVELLDGSKWLAKGTVKIRDERLLELAFIDVGQGDACLITTPDGELILVDGGETQQAARYLARKYSHQTERGSTVDLDAIVITHGDADHFAGISELILEAAREERVNKKIIITTKRVYHNGLVKGPSSCKIQTESVSTLLGKTKLDQNGMPVIVDLIDDIRTIPESKLNKHFKRWKEALNELAIRHAIEVKRLDSTSEHAFGFIKSLSVKVLGPTTVMLADGTPCLPIICDEDGHSPSDSRTINGHSVVLKLKYRNVGILLAGDLNNETENQMLSRWGDDLRSEVFKVPHHGSSDYSVKFFTTVSPLISIISAGDDKASNDYMHPRANVLGALGKSGRTNEALIFVTDLNAFDQYVGPSFEAKQASGEWVPDNNKKWFYARKRASYGITHVRTDGKTVFVVRRGARSDRVEAYAFDVDQDGKVDNVELDKP